MTAEKKIAQKRLTLLQVAESLRNVSEACRRQGISRSQFYEYKRAFQEGGLKGLLDRPPIAKSFPNETPAEVKEKVIKLSIEHPAWGPLRVSDNLRLEGVSVSPSTIRNLWIKEGLESRYKRILRLEEEKNGKGIELTEEQIRLIEKANPCFRERKVESAYPGYLLSQDTFFVGTIKGVGRIYLQNVVDTYGSYAFGKLYTSKHTGVVRDVNKSRVPSDRTMYLNGLGYLLSYQALKGYENTSEALPYFLKDADEYLKKYTKASDQYTDAEDYKKIKINLKKKRFNKNVPD